MMSCWTFGRRVGALLLPLFVGAAFAQPASNGKPSGDDAKECVQLTASPGENGGRPFHKLSNRCPEKIGLVWCHEPSGMPGVQSTECGRNNRYYQQFTTLESGRTAGNQYSTPGDARVRFGACMGGEGKIRQTTDGQYVCRP